MNKCRFAEDAPSEPRSRAERRCRRGENVAPAERRRWSAGRRRTPTSLGCARRIATARGGPSQGSPGVRSQAPRRLPALHFPCVQGRRKKGKGDARRPKIKVPGRRSVV